MENYRIFYNEEVVHIGDCKSCVEFLLSHEEEYTCIVLDSKGNCEYGNDFIDLNIEP